MTIQDFLKLVIASSKTNQWFSIVETLENGQHIALKGFGRWIQRLETQGYVESIPEQKTQKALKSELLKHINHG